MMHVSASADRAAAADTAAAAPADEPDRDRRSEPGPGRDPARDETGAELAVTVGEPDGADGIAPLRRVRSGRVVAGVAAGVAEHLDLPVVWVRIAFALLSGVGGIGVLGYGLLWAFVPEGQGSRPPSTVREQQQAIGLIALAVGLALATTALGNAWGGWLVGPLGLTVIGAAVVWREADSAQRRRWRSGAGVVLGGGRTAVLRVIAGAILVTGGITVFLINNGDLGQIEFVLLAVVATVLGVLVLTVPWWLRLVRDLGDERRARIRTEERAEIAAHLHDSVLQTLALIQQQAESSREVRRLARGQERELRTWLYGPKGYGKPTWSEDGDQPTVGDPAGTASLSGALGAAAAEVEDTYAVTVSPVVVGDCAMTEPLTALVQASREAMVNAAKHAGVTELSAYAEVEPGTVHVYVRDRGSGFDPVAVPDDRHGLADSIHGRMERNGGTVRLRSTLGEGTEVHLSMTVPEAGEET